MQTTVEPSARAALWRSVVRLDKGKINNTWLAARNSIAVALPLAIGIALGNPLGAVAVTTGALNVSYSDGRDPYAHRARRMLRWSILGAVAVFIGSVSGQYHWAAIPVVAVWAFFGGICVAVSSRAGDLGLNTLVAVIVFAARGPTSPIGASYAALLVLGGGLLQTGLALLWWPLRKYEPERRALSSVYAELAKQIDPHSDLSKPEPLTPPSGQVQDTLDALGRDHSIESERFRMLFDQADRVRISVFTLARLREALAEQSTTDSESVQSFLELLDRLFELTSTFTATISTCLLSGECPKAQKQLLHELRRVRTEIESKANAENTPLAIDISMAVGALAGQLRAVNMLATSSIPDGLKEFDEREEKRPSKLQIADWFEIIRANIDLRSAAFRHAVRLAVCVAIGDAIGRSISWERSYWLPMTIAVVLKPDFNTTIARGILRLAGTFAGLVLATVLFHIFPNTALTELFLVGAFTFAVRRWGPANYGVFSIGISGLIVFLIAVTGIPPAQVVAQRSINTIAGGLFALLAYSLWPTWERMHVFEALAQLIDASRTYFHAVVQRFSQDDPELEAILEEARASWRRSRTDAESSVDRVGSEPKVSAERLSLLTSILASSHSLMHSILALEAGIRQTVISTPPDVFNTFAKDVELTLYYMSASLRGSSAATATLPHLREDHTRMMEARDRFASTDEFVLLETDRITTSLNTLREQVERLVAAGDQAASLSEPAPATAL